jgi:PAS domain S-box-containing protein
MKNNRLQSTPIKIKNSILDSIVIIILIVGTPALIMSIINKQTFGHFPYFSLAGYFLIVSFVIFRKKISFHIKAWTIITFGFLIGISSLLHEGILSDGLLYFVLISIISSMLINIRSGIIITVISVIIASTVAFAAIKGWVKYDFDIVKYFYSSNTWISFIISATFFTSLSVYIYGRLEYYIARNLTEITQKSRKIIRSKQKLEREIAERQLTENQLMESENKFRKVFNSIDDGIALLRSDHTIFEVNNNFLQMTGSSSVNAAGKPISLFFSDPQRVDLLLHSKAVSNSIFNLSEYWLIQENANRFVPVEVRILPLQFGKDIRNIAIIKDISGKKESDIRIMHAVINSEEEERKRIAQDLHDTIGPYLSAAKLYTNSLMLDENNVKGHEIQYELNELLSLCIGSIREISGNLGAHVLRIQGLHAALNNFIEKVSINSNISYELFTDKHIPFVEQVEIALFRILVELINNSVKYSSATNIKIRHQNNDHTVVIEYIENGMGFDVSEALNIQKGMGLYNIHSRINSLGGLIEYNSAPGKGVQVKITFSKALAYKKEIPA